MSQKKISGKGLHSIASVLGRSEATADPKWEPKPNRQRGTTEGIAKITADKIIASVDVGDPRGAAANMIHHFVKAGIRDAYNLGHAEALAQGSEVDKMLDKQYEVRTSLLTPTVVCAVMEQSGLSSMSLDLARMATVFERCDVQYTLDADTNIMSYTMRPVGSFYDGALGTSVDHPQEIDPTDPRDDLWCGTLDTETRAQVEDIEQTAGPINVDSEQFEDKI